MRNNIRTFQSFGISHRVDWYMDEIVSEDLQSSPIKIRRIEMSV